VRQKEKTPKFDPQPHRYEPPGKTKEPEPKKEPPVATTHEVKDGSWVGQRFRR
jgi:hypothetical protein